MDWEEQCPRCKEWWVSCPCCHLAFCPSCGMALEEAEDYAEDLH